MWASRGWLPPTLSSHVHAPHQWTPRTPTERQRFTPAATTACSPSLHESQTRERERKSRRQQRVCRPSSRTRNLLPLDHGQSTSVVAHGRWKLLQPVGWSLAWSSWWGRGQRSSDPAGLAHQAASTMIGPAYLFHMGEPMPSSLYILPYFCFHGRLDVLVSCQTILLQRLVRYPIVTVLVRSQPLSRQPLI